MSIRFAVRLSVDGQILATSEELLRCCTRRPRLNNVLGLARQLNVGPATADPIRVPVTSACSPKMG